MPTNFTPQFKMYMFLSRKKSSLDYDARRVCSRVLGVFQVYSSMARGKYVSFFFLLLLTSDANVKCMNLDIEECLTSVCFTHIHTHEINATFHARHESNESIAMNKFLSFFISLMHGVPVWAQNKILYRQ